MKQSVLPLLACPARMSGRLCSGPLSIDSGAALALRFQPRDVDDIQEGFLRCARCSREYPVLSGVAVLVPDPEEYVRGYYPSLLRDIGRHGELSGAARSWLARRYGRRAGTDDYGADFRFSQQFEDPWDVARVMAEEPGERYGGFADWLRSIRGDTPYDLLARWARELAQERGLVLDAGCGGGGMLARVAPHFQAAFGVDWSFLAVLLARRAVLHRPEAERSYRLSVRIGEEVERPLNVPRADNGEFLVGDCGAAPFPNGLFDTVCSSNVIDMAGLDKPLDDAARLLRPGGLLVLSDPFYFRKGEAPPGEPRAAVRAALASRGLQVAEERDGVPWAWATYDRHWRLYFNYCVAARKS